MQSRLARRYWYVVVPRPIRSARRSDDPASPPFVLKIGKAAPAAHRNRWSDVALLLFETVAGVAVGAGFFCGVAVNAPLHGERRFFEEPFTCSHLTVALFTSGAMVEMRFMTEVHKGRQLVDAYPGNRRFRLLEFGEVLDRWFIGGDCLMALHTDIRLRNFEVFP